MAMKEIKHILEQSQLLQKEVNRLQGVSKPKFKHGLPELEQVVTDSALYKSVAKLFRDGHHAEAVKKAFVYLNNLIKRQTNSKADGVGLMRSTFSPKNPTLILNALSNQSEQDEQLGYMEIMAGVMTGIRNPRVHEHDWEDTEERALQLLSLANHLVLRVGACTVPNTPSISGTTTT
jgi:uncharacterized protein (TIGR02391 family)